MTDPTTLDLRQAIIAAQHARTLDVRGRPAPQGSKRHVGGGRMIESSRHVSTWRDNVRAAALAHPDRPAQPLDGPLAALMVFTLPKPASAPKRKRTWPMRYPDLSKLARATEDALTTAGWWADDARVVQYDRLAKVYPGEDVDALDVPGARIWVRVLDGSIEGMGEWRWRYGQR